MRPSHTLLFKQFSKPIIRTICKSKSHTTITLNILSFPPCIAGHFKYNKSLIGYLINDISHELIYKFHILYIPFSFLQVISVGLMLEVPSTCHSSCPNVIYLERIRLVSEDFFHRQHQLQFASPVCDLHFEKCYVQDFG